MPYGGTGSPADQARVMVGDTNASAPLLDDPTWTAILAAVDNNVGMAAHRAAIAIAGKYAQQPDRSLGPLRISYSQKSKSYLALADELLKNASSDPLAMRFVAPLCGGITDPNTGNAIPPFFTRYSP